MLRGTSKERALAAKDQISSNEHPNIKIKIDLINY